jgi:hypothetical protein
MGKNLWIVKIFGSSDLSEITFRLSGTLSPSSILGGRAMLISKRNLAITSG